MSGRIHELVITFQSNDVLLNRILRQMIPTSGYVLSPAPRACRSNDSGRKASSRDYHKLAYGSLPNETDKGEGEIRRSLYGVWS